MSENPVILIIDDDPVSCENLSEILQIQGYETHTAPDGRTGLEKAGQLLPDLILLDVMMPEMDGFETCRHLRHNPATGQIPILFLTALDDRDSRIQGIEVGADDFISKPFDRQELQARIRTITRLNRYRLLQAERARFEHVVMRAEIGYVIINEAGFTLFANPKARIYLDIAPEDALPPDPFLFLAQQQYRLEPPRAWETWPRPGEETRYLVRPATKQAEALWLQVDVMDSLADSGEKTYIVSLMDVSARMSFQQNVYAFHRVMQHKLRTPLVAILSGLELLVNYSNQLSPQESAELISGAYENAVQLNDAVRDILQYVSLSRSSVKGDYFDLDTLPGIVEQLCQDSGLKPARLRSLPDKGILLSLSTVAMRFILMELLENARKFHPQHSPQIEIELQIIDDNQLLFTITDDGAGVPQERLEQVWLPYYQGEKRFTGEIKGMGLGLATVATLVAQFNGRYRLYNKPGGNGAVVELTLPILMSE